MNEHYPTLLEMAPRHKKYPVTWFDGWSVFRGPRIWTLAPDWYIVARSNEPKVLLSSLFVSDKQFFVLLFDGIDHGDTTSDTKMFADELEKRFPDLLDCFVVTRYYEAKVYDPIDNVLGDIDLSLEKIFGATGQCAYVIDIDKKIVWKSCGLMKEELQKWLWVKK